MIQTSYIFETQKFEKNIQT